LGFKFHEDPQEAQLLSGMTLDDPDFGKESSDKFGVLSLVKENKISEQKWPTANPELCSAFYRELAKALSTGSAVPVTGKDGRNVIRLIELALESARSGRTVDV
jgi:predicted dehydrogenase